MSDLKNKEVFTISDAAEFLSVNKNTIYNWMNLGIIKGTRISPPKGINLQKDILRIFEDSKGYEPPKRK